MRVERAWSSGMMGEPGSPPQRQPDVARRGAQPRGAARPHRRDLRQALGEDRPPARGADAAEPADAHPQLDDAAVPRQVGEPPEAGAVDPHRRPIARRAARLRAARSREDDSVRGAVAPFAIQ